MRYFVTVKQWNFHSFNTWIFSSNLFVVKRASEVFKFYNKYTLSVSLFRSIQFRHLYRKLHKETEGLFWEKAALNLLLSCWSVPFEFSFCEGKTRFTHAIAANKRANSHNFKIKNLNLLTITFLAVYLMNKGKSSYTNESSMRLNNTFR